MDKTEKKRQKEQKVVYEMIARYCRKNPPGLVVWHLVSGIVEKKSKGNNR